MRVYNLYSRNTIFNTKNVRNRLMCTRVSSDVRLLDKNIKRSNEYDHDVFWKIENVTEKIYNKRYANFKGFVETQRKTNKALRNVEFSFDHNGGEVNAKS